MTKNNLSMQKNTETISDRLRYLIDKVGIKQVHLANKLGVTPQAIHQLCNGKQHFSKHTQKIAHLLNVDETWLKTGQGMPFSNQKVATTTKEIREFPVYHLSQLNQVKSIRARLGSLIPQELYVTARTYHQDTLGFYVEDTGFSPKFDKDDIVLIEPTPIEEIKNGSIILIYSQELNKTILCYSQKIKNNAHIGWQPTMASTPIFFNIGATDLIYGIYRECLKTSY